MKLALTVWGNRLSPVFDSARKLLVVQIKNNKVTDRQYKNFDTETYSDLPQMLSGLKADVLICGAISKRFSNIIEASGIDLIPFVSGYVDVVVESYAKENCVSPDFFMPGCRNKHCRHKYRMDFVNSNKKADK